MSSKLRPNKLLLGLYGLLVAGLPLAGLGYALLGSLGLAGPLATGFTGRHWLALGTDSGLLKSALFSLWIAGASLGLAVALALALVLGAQATLRRRPFPTLLYVPLLMPSLVMGFYLFQLLSRAGWLSRLSFGLGLTHSVDPQHPGHLSAFGVMQLPGTPQKIEAGTRPWGGSHRLFTSIDAGNGDQSHSSTQAGPRAPDGGYVYGDAWDEMYGVP